MVVNLMSRVILHSDLNNFYASVECLYNPELRELPVAVGGDVEQRHGIVLAKNYIAKKFGVQTGEALWQAREKCPKIVFVQPHFDLYMHYSEMARKIYSDYSDQIEPFGIDEAWIDVTGSQKIFGNGKTIADEIRERIKFEMGVTASVGVSFNKIFAKLGSDMKKPDATTVITPEDFKQKIWPLPVSDLLYVGHSTTKKLMNYSIQTIGDLARRKCTDLQYWLGKNGVMLWRFANGLDTSPVSNIGAKSLIKSVGNSTTTPRDLVCESDIKITLYSLSESVAARLREYEFLCRTVQITIRDNKLESFERQVKLSEPACVSSVIADAAHALFRKNVHGPYAIRSLGVRACDLVLDHNRQLSMLPEIEKIQKKENIEVAVDSIRKRFGHFSIQRGIMLADKNLSDLNPKDDNIIHPVSFLK
jgi:Nucleotidyltransferase/DNA polymerase involved in DNA repair